MINSRTCLGWLASVACIAVLGCKPDAANQIHTEKGAQAEESKLTQSEAATADSIVVATNAIQPHMAIDSNDSVYLTFIHSGNISVCVSDDGGDSFTDPIVAIDLRGRGRGGAHRGPRIGVDGKGNLTITAPATFDDAEYEKRYPTTDLFVVRSLDRGKTWTKPKRINEVEKQAPEALHWTSVAPSGEAHVAWLDRRDREGPGQDIYYATIVDGEVGANLKVASTACECCAPGLAVDETGNALVAYREGGDNPSREIFARRSSDGGRSFLDAVQVNKEKTLEHG